MQTINPTLTVIIPTCNRPDALWRLLESLEPQVTGKPQCSTVVVNDGSHDDDYERLIRRFGFVIYIPLPENRGGGASRNAGAAKATGEYLVFTDDDCIPPPHWIDWLLSTVTEFPFYAAIAGPAFFKSGSHSGLIQSYIKDHGFLPKPYITGESLRVLPTANLAVHRDWFNKIGGFSEKYKYGNDLLFTQKLLALNAPVYIDKHWFTYHDNYGIWGLLTRSYRFGKSRGFRLANKESDVSIDGSPITSFPELLKTLTRRPVTRREALHKDYPPVKRHIYKLVDYLRYITGNFGRWQGYRQCRSSILKNDEQIRLRDIQPW